MTEQIKHGTIARIEVTRGTLTEYPIAEKVRGGWQNGVTMYPDADVTGVRVRYAAVTPIESAEARRLLALAGSRPSSEWPTQTGEYKSDVLAQAQINAMLALVEQQRIANLLTVAGWVVDSRIEDVSYDLDKLRAGVAGEVWEGLGLL